jgi:hypothetical protein
VKIDVEGLLGASYAGLARLKSENEELKEVRGKPEQDQGAIKLGRGTVEEDR